MSSFKADDRPSAIEVCENLIMAKHFSIDAIKKTNLKAFIF